MFKRIFALLACCSLFSITSAGYAQAPGKISGYMFGDYYYVLNNHDSAMEERNGFWFRRIYLTYDQGLSDQFAIRFRIEMANSGNFSSNSKLNPFVKDAYLKWKSKGGHQILLGLSGTPTWGFVEKTWGYRSVEKTPADLYKVGSSRDFGVAVKGKLGTSKRASYHVMLGNGSSTGTETNSGKKAAIALGYKLTSGLSAEVYADFEERPGESNRTTKQGFLTYNTKSFRLGAQVLQQTRQASPEDVDILVGSVFGVAKLSQKTSAFARFDRAFEPIPDGPKVSYIPFTNTNKFKFLLFGLDFTPISQVHLMPNVEIVMYDEVTGATSPDADVIPRFTFFYTWK